MNLKQRLNRAINALGYDGDEEEEYVRCVIWTHKSADNEVDQREIVGMWVERNGKRIRNVEKGSLEWQKVIEEYDKKHKMNKITHK